MNAAAAFGRLGIAPTRDIRSIKRAYALALKAIDQASEREAFERLREAYEQALAWAAAADDAGEQEAQGDDGDPDDGDATGFDSIFDNPNIAGGYASSVGEVVGMVSSRTLLPGRTIQVSALRAPFAVKRGTTVRLTFAVGSMIISASGTPLDNASIGDVLRVRNLDSGVTVSGTVMGDGTVQVMAK